MSRKFTEHGQEVEVVSDLPTGGAIIRMIYTREDEGEFEGQPSLYNGQLFDKAPTEKLDAKIAKLEAQLARFRETRDGLAKEIRETEALHKSRMAKFAKYPDLSRLEDFLDGKLTHYAFLNEWGSPCIKEAKDCKCGDDERERELKLLCLFGKPHKGVYWALNHYKDGSGGYETVVPCTSYDQALEVVRDNIKGRIESSSKDPRPDHLAAADHFQVPVPDEYRLAVRTKLVKNKEEQLAKARGAVSLAEGELQVLNGTSYEARGDNERK